MVEVLDVTKKYGNKIVVDGVNLRIAKGKITSLIGPNGAGKSTLLSMISRLIASDAGSIIVDGLNVVETKSNDLAKTVSILKQSNQINIRLTVKDLVGFGRFPHSQGRHTKEDRRMIAEAISYMGLEDLQDTYLDHLSGGQRQRAYIAMVLAQDTEYILLDEPLNNLDMTHSVQIMSVLRRLVDELGKTIVLVLHDINFASCYSDDIIAMKDGKIVKIGDTNDMINSGVLKKIYGMDIPIETINGNRICVYFREGVCTR